jgi:hypothetical protein
LRSKQQCGDRELAISLWRSANEQGIPDDAVAAAINLGFQLGLDSEMPGLTHRLAGLANRGEGGVQSFAIEELVTLNRDWHKRTEYVEQAYRTGAAPIHVIAQTLRRPLVEFFHDVLEKNAANADPKYQFSVYIRYGGRPILREPPIAGAPRPRLHVDITSILFAAHLGVLKSVESKFGPLRIPVELIPALMEMRESVSPHQPSRTDHARKILDFLQRGLLHEVTKSDSPGPFNQTNELAADWLRLFERARNASGYLLDFLPIRKRLSAEPEKELPPGADQVLVNCRAIAESLRQDGPLSEQEYRDALAALGTEGEQPPSLVPTQQSPIFCRIGTVELLAGAGILPICCQRFRMYVEPDQTRLAREQLHDSETRLATSDWLSRLINQINVGIDRGTYNVLPDVQGGSADEDESEADQHGLPLRSLVTLLRFRPAEGDVIWADDRYITRFQHRDGVPIVGTNDILLWLNRIAEIAAEDYYSLINLMRASNVRFIPVDPAEICHHLANAKHKDGVLVETSELRILRRYMAAVMNDAGALERPVHPSNGIPNELTLVLGMHRAVLDALKDVWSSGADDETCHARCEWLLQYTYVDMAGLVYLSSGANPDYRYSKQQ